LQYYSLKDVQQANNDSLVDLNFAEDNDELYLGQEWNELVEYQVVVVQYHG
jgi:hypothetical protein